MERERFSYADTKGLQLGIRDMRVGGWQVEEVHETTGGGFEATFIRALPDSVDTEPADFDPTSSLPPRWR